MDLNPITLAISAHPLSGDMDLRYVSAGLTLAETLAGQGIEGEGWILSVGGMDVPARLWPRVRVKAGQIVEARSVVRKQVVQLAAIVALSYFTFGAGGLALGAAAGGAAGTTAGLFAAGGAIGGGFWAAASVYAAGSLVINSLLAPKTTKAAASSAAENPTYSISGGRNQQRQFESLALVLGETKMVPDLAAQPYSEFRGEDQYCTTILHAGINCGSIDQIKVGDTLLSNYDGVEVRRGGFPAGNDAVFPAPSVDTIAGALLDNTSGVDGGGTWVTRTTSIGTVRIAIDLEATLTALDEMGVYQKHGVSIELQYAPTGTGAWQPILGGAHELVSIGTKPYRNTLLLDVPSGQYDVRARKNSVNDTKTTLQNTVTWTQLKSYQQDLADYGGQPRVRIDIKASGQLSGSFDEVNWIARAAALPVWNGAAWVTATDPGAAGISNPGAQALMLLRGLYRDSDGRRIAGVGLPDSRIDLDSWKEFMVRCTAMDFRFDAVIQQAMSIGDLVDSVLDAGWARLTRYGGKYGVTWLAEDQPIEGVINMASIGARSFSVDYNLTPGADELQYQFFDRDSSWSWQSVRVKAPGTDTPMDTASLAVLGITRAPQAAMRARLTMAQNVYGRKSISLDVDLEHMVYRGGSVLALSHDLTQWGYGGRLRSISPGSGSFTVRVDEPVPTNNPGTRGLGLQLPGEKQMRTWAVSAVSSDGRDITVSAAWPGMLSGFGPEDVRWMYDFKSTPGQRVRVASIQPKAKMAGATIVFVPEDPQFWTYVLTGAWTPPSNNSLLQRGATITRAQITEQLERQGTTYFTELTVTFDVAGNYDHAEVWGATAGTALQKLGETRTTSFSWRGGLDDVWSVEVRPFTALSAGPAFAMGYAVVGLRLPPPDIETLSLNGTLLSWDTAKFAAVPDLAGYRLRFNYGGNTDWGVATPLHTGLLTDSPYRLEVLPPGPITILAKADDTTGNQSEGSPALYANLGDPEVVNILLQRDYRALAWPGTYTGAHVTLGDLVADNTAPFYAAAEARFYNPNPNAAFYTANFAAMEWVSDRWFLGAGLQGSTLTLAADIEGVNYSIEYRRPGHAPFYADDPTMPFYGATDSAFYPPDEPWQVWPGSLTVDDVLGYYQYRVRIGAGAVQGAIREFTATVDVPDREVVQQLQSIGPGATRLTNVAGLFNVIKTVRGVLEGSPTASGFVVLDYDADLGPLIQPYAGASPGGTGILNYDIKGY